MALFVRKMQRCMAPGARNFRSHAGMFEPASTSAARESPFPVVFFGSINHASSAWKATSLPSRLNRAGFVVGYLDLPGFGSAKAWDGGQTMDDLVDDVRGALFSRYKVAPVVVAPSVSAVIVQKLLESYPLAGAVLLSPLPPQPNAWLARHVNLFLHNNATGSSVISMSAENAASWLRRSAGSSLTAASYWTSGDATSCTEDELDELTGLLEAVSSIDSSQESAAKENRSAGARAPLCGFDAAGDWLNQLSTAPVQLEPQPVPLLTVFGQRDRLLSEEDMLATINFHQLDGGGTEALQRAQAACQPRDAEPGAPSRRPVSPAAEREVVVVPGAGHDLLHSGAEPRAAALEAVAAWIEHRF